MNSKLSIQQHSDVERRTHIWQKVNYRAVFLLFFFGSIAGFFMEGLWSQARTGQWVHHSALIWGPFCLVYGIGAVVMYAAYFYVEHRNTVIQFFAYFLIGSIVEYVSSAVQQLCLGSTSWDYSGEAMNLGGRICLGMALVWGALGIIVSRFIFPLIKKPLSRLKGKRGIVLCGVLTLYMAANIFATTAVIWRWHDRVNDIPAQNLMETVIDRTYTDTRMEALFPNMNFV